VSDLKTSIQEDTKTALKAGDKVRVGTLRLLSAAIKNREIEMGKEATDDDVRAVAIKEAKRRRESIEAYRSAGREELAAAEEAELEILKPFLPEQLSEAELSALIDEALASTGATSPKEMGKVMGAVMAKAKGKADGTVVQELVKAKLGA
jgi:uncharacterized protein YqeY